MYLFGFKFIYNRDLYQLLDPFWLKENLFESLFYLHSQPPLFNLLFGVGEYILGPFARIFFNILFILLSFITIVYAYKVLLILRINKALSFLVIFVYLISPATMLYENWFFYTQIIVFLLILAIHYLLKFINTSNYSYLKIYFYAIALVTLFSAFFHLIWLFILYLIPILIVERGRKKILFQTILPFIIVLSVYLKNFILFDNFSTSSWLGLNLSRIATRFIDKDIKLELIQNNIISKASLFRGFPDKQTFEKIKELYPYNKVGITVLDKEYKKSNQINFNNSIFIKLSKDALKDNLYLIKSYFPEYMLSVKESILLYFKSPTDYGHLESNRNLIPMYNKFFDSFFYGSGKYTKTGLLSLIIISSIVVLTIFSLSIIISDKKKFLFLLFSLINIIYVFIISSFLEYGENNRFRFYNELYFYLLVAVTISILIKNRNKDYNKILNEHN